VTDDRISKETKDEALRIARGTQRPGQTKEQTKLIAHGIEKGIAEYKKKQKAKSRERDKLRRKELKAKKQKTDESPELQEAPSSTWLTWLPWFLLALSLLYFVGYPLLSDRLS